MHKTQNAGMEMQIKNLIKGIGMYLHIVENSRKNKSQAIITKEEKVHYNKKIRGRKSETRRNTCMGIGSWRTSRIQHMRTLRTQISVGITRTKQAG